MFSASRYSIVFLLLLPHTGALADELLVRASRPEQQRILVLNNGRVVVGRLTLRPGGYDVSFPSGHMFVGEKQVRFVADGMDDAYRMMSESFTQRTPDTHLTIARWCLANGLTTHARREVLDALHLDPYREEARRMLGGIVRQQTQSVSLVSHEDSPSDDESAPERRSLGGLPKDSAQLFTQRIQPILTNKCGNARCHGTPQNEFVVLPVRGTSTAYIAEQNLAAVLNQIDFRLPGNSPLLQATTGLHGGSRTLLFSGRTGAVQAETLRQWVNTIGNQLAPAASRDQPVAAVHQDANTGHDDHGTASLAPPAQLVSATSETSTQQKELDQEFVREAAEHVRRDEFNPDSFNLRYHGRSSRTFLPQEDGIEHLP